MAIYYASLVDIFIYFPMGVFPLVGDDMRSSDTKHQEEHDQNLKKTFQELGVPNSKIYYLKQHTVKDRVAEIISIISK